jgi:alcohol dehydrogenase
MTIDVEFVMKMYSFKTAKKIIFGWGAVKSVGEEAKQLGIDRTAIITDKGVIKVGVIDKVKESLEKEGIEFKIWDGVESEPSLEIAEEAASFVRSEEFDGVIGVGGGSTLDTAKASALSINNLGKITEIFERQPAPFLLIPTTAGTGSEVSNVAIFSTPDVKHALYSSLMYPDLAIVDPELTVTLPPFLTAQTGIDALCHAIEAYTSLKANIITDTLALKAIELIVDNIRSAYSNGTNVDARTGMSYTALIAGIAFGNAGTVIGHACGYAYVYPATDIHLPHGLAIAITMPYVLRYNAIADLKKHVNISNLLGGSTRGLSLRDAATRCASDFKQLLIDLDVKTSLKDVGVTKDMIPKLAKNVFKSKNHVARNPRIISEQDMINLFEDSYNDKL